MAHNVTDRDGLFTVREPAWHRLGHVFDDYPTRAEAQAIAHPWEPVTTPLFTEEPIITEEGAPDTDFEEVSGWQAVQRSDTGAVLGVVSDTYGLVTNDEMYDIAEAIEGEAKGDVRFETGGSLKGGAKVWLLVRLQEPLVINGDESTATIPYYALQNAHDGSGSFRGQATMTRIVCDNTAQMADLDARQRGTEFTFRHTRLVKERIEEARQALAGWRESVDTYRMLAEHLGTERVSGDQYRDFVERFIPAPPPSTATDRVMRNVEEARSTWLGIYRGEANERIRGTRWGLVQASVEYLNHGRKAHTLESRFRRSYLDRDVLVRDAMKIAQAV